MARLCSLLGNPERAFPAIHVLGTNGKGSVCAALDSILRESGYRTARYTSPHLDHLGERLTFDGTILPAETWDEALDLVIGTVNSDSRLSEDPPSAFEIMTTVAFLCIARGNREIAVIEAGLGGRLDATNLLGDVRMTVFTAIGLDHEDILGQGIEAIAREKYSVLRRGVPAVSAAGGALLDGLAAARAKKTGSPLAILGRDAKIASRISNIQGSSFELSQNGFAPLRLSTPLLGEHQVDNAALASLACLKLSRCWAGISVETVRRGLEKTRWPGRMERIPPFPPRPSGWSTQSPWRRSAFKNDSFSLARNSPRLRHGCHEGQGYHRNAQGSFQGAWTTFLYRNQGAGTLRNSANAGRESPKTPVARACQGFP